MTVGVLWLFLMVPLVGQLCVIVVFPGHTLLLFIPFSVTNENFFLSMLIIYHNAYILFLYLSVKINAYKKHINVISITSEMICYQSLLIDAGLNFHCSVFYNF